MYFIGIAAVLVAAIILKKTKPFSGKPAPFVMELPQYHIPSAKTVLLHVWERLKGFLIKAGTILFLACVVMWFLQGFGFVDGAFGMVEDSGDSLLAAIGGLLAPIFAPLGFGQWQAVAASLARIYGERGHRIHHGRVGKRSRRHGGRGKCSRGRGVLVPPPPWQAFSFLLFNLLDSPCLAAIATMAQQMQSRKWFWFAILFQNIFAYLVCLCVYQLGSFAMGGAFGRRNGCRHYRSSGITCSCCFGRDPYKNQKVYSKRSVQA